MEAPPLTGYIEGYYGRQLSWENRKLLIEKLSQLSLTTYLYAPKEDPWHRQLWRAPYPPSFRSDFGDLISLAQIKKVDFIPALAPGLSFDYLSRLDYQKLLKKFRYFLDSGAETVALLMDDIPEELPKNCRTQFHSLGEAHGKLISLLLTALQKHSPASKLWFCPTVYCDKMAGEGGVERSTYLLDLVKNMPPDIPLLWTGPEVISPNLDSKSIEAISRLCNNNVIIWDNIYANDYCPFRLTVGPYRERKRSLLTACRGVLLNPTGLPETDRLLLNSFGLWMKGKSPVDAWRQSLRACIPYADEFNTVLPAFLPPPLTKHSIKINTARYRRALKPLIWDWKSALHDEWYPYLYMTDTDCMQMEAKPQERQPLVRRKYPPILSESVLGE